MVNEDLQKAEKKAKAAQDHGPLYWGLVGLGFAGILAACYSAARNHAFYESPKKQETTAPTPGTIEEKTGWETIIKTE